MRHESVAADSGQGGDIERVAAAKSSFKLGPSQATTDQDGAGDSHVLKNVGMLHPSSAMAWSWVSGCIPAWSSTAAREVRI